MRWTLIVLLDNVSLPLSFNRQQVGLITLFIVCTKTTNNMDTEIRTCHSPKSQSGDGRDQILLSSKLHKNHFVQPATGFTEVLSSGCPSVCESCWAAGSGVHPHSCSHSCPSAPARQVPSPRSQTDPWPCHYSALYTS